MKRWIAVSLALAGYLYAADAGFEYYLLTLSWAPDFCAAPGGNKDPRECGAGQHVGFVVHGLWPQAVQGRASEDCASNPVKDSTVTAMLRYIPTEGLIQHEWKTHGSCSGLSADDYFAAVRTSRDSVKIPAVFESMTIPASESAEQVEAQFADANAAFPRTAFRATCRGGTLQEVRICLDLNFKPQSCPVALGRCSTGAMNILPPQ